MKRALVGILSVVACTAIVGTAAAINCPGGQQNPSGLNNGNGDLAGVKVGLHVQAYNSSKSCTTNAPSQLGCDSPNSTSSLDTDQTLGTRSSVYIVALDVPTGVGMQGATFGLDFSYDTISYEGVYIQSFTKCMDLDFPSVTPAFPSEPGSGVVVTSAGCLGTVADPSDPQGEALVVIGWLDATGYYVPGPLSISPRLYLANPDFQIANCSAGSSNPCYPLFAGSVGFGNGGGGYSPCVEVPIATEPTTWSRLKSMGHGE